MSSTFRPPSKSLTPRDYQFIAVVLIIFLVICTALIFANQTLKGGGDFFATWVGARAFLFDRIDPYSGEVSVRVQKMVYQGLAETEDEPYILDTPFQILPFYYPFSLISDPLLARAVFTLILELAVFATAILSLSLTDWEAPYFFIILFILFAVFNFYSFQALHEANPVLILGFLYAAIIFTYRAGIDELTGALMAVSLYYWEVGGLLLFFIFLRVIYEKRTRVFAGFFMVCFILFFISFLTYPNWIIPFLRATVNNLRVDFGFNTHAIFNEIWPAYGDLFAWIFIGLLVIILGFEWNSARCSDERRFYWACCLSIAIAPLLGFRTEMEHLAVLIIPLALIFSVVHDRWYRFGNFLIILFMLIIFLLPWILFLYGINRFGDIAWDIIFLFLPLSTLIGLYWVRWWAIHPPRVLIGSPNRS